MGLALVIATAVVLAARPGQADEFPLKYMGGKPDLKKKADGVLVVEQDEVYFRNRRGQRLFTLARAGAYASVLTQEKTSIGCVIGMMPVALAFYGAVDPETPCKRTQYRVQIRHGADTLTFKATAGQASRVVTAVNR